MPTTPTQFSDDLRRALSVEHDADVELLMIRYISAQLPGDEMMAMSAAIAQYPELQVFERQYRETLAATERLHQTTVEQLSSPPRPRGGR